MTNKDLIYVIEQIGREKGIGKEVLFEAVESALLSASKKTMGLADNVRMELDRHTGSLRVFARKKVVEAVTDAKLEIGLEEARKLNGEAELEDELEMELPPQEFGRIAAQTAKQVILQRVRDAERDAVYSEFIDKEGRIVRGVVHRVEKRNVIVEIGKAEAVLMEREQIPGERYNPSDRIRAYVLEVKKGIKGPQILLSRTHPGFLVRLFETEIPEIAEGIVQVREAAREGGGARQGRRGVDQARRGSDRRLRGLARHANPGHQPGAARREDRHRGVVAGCRDVRRAGAVAGQGQLGDHQRARRRRRAAVRARDRAGQPALPGHRQAGTECAARREADRSARRHQERERGRGRAPARGRGAGPGATVPVDLRRRHVHRSRTH